MLMDQWPAGWRLQGMAGLEFFRYVTRQFEAHGCRQSAAALTYMTLFALIPMLTVMHSMFSLVPVFQHWGLTLSNGRACALTCCAAGYSSKP